MAKRIPPGEKPFSPVDEALVRGVLNPVSPVAELGTPQTESRRSPVQKLVDIPRKSDTPAATSETSESSELERLTREKRVLLTSTEEWELERLIGDIAAKLRTPLKSSHVLRAAVMLLRHASDELVKQSQRIGPLKRPPNGDIIALTAFEHYLAELIDSALRSTRPFR